jgi:glycosyltransferase involved in cell wall biosynthesis
MPPEKFASSRIRAFYPCQYLAEAKYDSASIGYDAEAEVAIVIQSCENDVWEKIRNNRRQFLIYDVCDRYFENRKTFKRPGGDIDSLDRYEELVERADLIIVPTRELKVEIASRNPSKAVVFVPECIDYAPDGRRLQPDEGRTVLWFGNPDRGNFESTRWMIEHLRDEHGYTPLLVSRKSFFKKFPDLLPFVVDWSPEAMEEAFERSSLCVLAHAREEGTKSPNRFITAIMHGVPTLVCTSPSVEEILRQADMTFAITDTVRKLDRALDKLANPTKRKPFVEKLQRRFRAQFGSAAIAQVYQNLFNQATFEKITDQPLNVAFISHNLSVGEGAPWSLFELAAGLNERPDIRSFGYSAGSGPLSSMYKAADVSLTIFDPSMNHCIKALGKRYAEARAHFLDFLDKNAIDVVICNTVRAAPYVMIAEDAGRPSILIIRESFDAKERFRSYEGEPRVASEVGVAAAAAVVFVAATSREAWLDQNFLGEVRMIPNGVSPGRFEASLSATKASVRAELDLPQDDVIAVCVGTVNLRKGQQGILDAFVKLPAEVRNRARIVFLGAVEGSYLPVFQEAIAAVPDDSRERIHLVRTSPDAGPWYRAADFFLMNSTSEAYPRSVVEALLFGLPVLSTKVFGVLEQIQHGDNGFLYDFDDEESWLQYFTLLVTDGKLLKTMSNAARRSFWKLTTYAEMLHSYRALLGEVYRRARRRPGATHALIDEAHLLIESRAA